MSANLDRGLVLFGRLRFDLAEGFFQEAALEEPEDARMPSWLTAWGNKAVRGSPSRGW